MKISAFRFDQRFRSISAVFAAIIVPVVFWSVQIAAATDSTRPNAKNPATKNIRITADKLIAKIDAAEIEFIGSVRATQAGVVITADYLKIIYDPDVISNKERGKTSTSIRKISARGSVKIAYDDIVAEANSAEYTIKSAVLVLRGEPSRVARGGDSISGSKFTLQRSDGNMKVESSGANQVRAIFQP